MTQPLDRVWYHSIELRPGVVTPGQVDLRGAAKRALPARVAGRALDVGTFDGFWAFELERRGAEVVAIDVDAVDAAQLLPRERERLVREAAELGVRPGEGFRIAAQALRSRVRRVSCDVMDLDAERIGGPVDLAFVGALLLHLRDPTGALERVLSVLRPGGRLRLVEPFGVMATLRFPRRPVAEFEARDFNWWMPNLAALRAWPRAAGFEDARVCGLVRSTGANELMRGPYAVVEARRP